jgi:hypothetical protein
MEVIVKIGTPLFTSLVLAGALVSAYAQAPAPKPAPAMPGGPGMMGPARYFMEISRGIVMKGIGLGLLWPQFAALALYTALVFAAASLLFRKKVA